jgi:hypothetical protein
LRKHQNDRLPLAMKLKELLDPHKKVLKVLKINPELFSNRAVIIRKYYVHGIDKNIRKQDIDPKNVIRLTYRLEHIIKVLLLAELGFTDKEIIKIIEGQPWNWGITN